MTPDAAGRPGRSDLTVDQHRMVAPSRVWLMPPPGDPTWYAGTWKSNPLTVVVGDVPYVPESALRAAEQERDAADREARALLGAMVHADSNPEFRMLPGVAGKITQINNAVAALREQVRVQAKAVVEFATHTMDCNESVLNDRGWGHGCNCGCEGSIAAARRIVEGT